MPRPTKGPRLGGSPAHERLIISNLCRQLIHHGSVVTTEAKARRVRPHMEKLITKAKKGDTHNRRLALRTLKDRETAYILFEELGPKFMDREGGYTRIVKLPNRKGDNAPMAQISLVLEPVSKKSKKAAPAEAAAEAPAPEAEEAVEVVAEDAVEAVEAVEDAPAAEVEAVEAQEADAVEAEAAEAEETK